MNEELIKRCAREICPGVEQNYRRYAAAVMAIETYHDRHVAPLVEAANRLAVLATDERVGTYRMQDIACQIKREGLTLKQALAPFQQQEARDA